MQTFSYKGKAYKRVPNIIPDESATPTSMCLGCKFRNNSESRRTQGCAAVKAALGDNYCDDDIWIPDTLAGMAKYIALKLEN